MKPELWTLTKAACTAGLGALLIAGCGGGGGGGGDAGSGSTGGSSTPAAGVTAQQCSPNNPYVADALSATTPGNIDSEKRWLRAYLDAAYLWYAEIPAVDASLPVYSNDTRSGFYDSMDAYFQALKTPALSVSGLKRKDAFSFTYPTKEWTDLSQSGIAAGYGIEWSFASTTAPRGIRIAYIDPATPAAAAGLLRGDTLILADGVSGDDQTSAGVQTLNEALYPSTLSTPHNFVFSRGGSTLPTTTLVSVNAVKQPVLSTQVLDVGGRRVGYLVFNDHLATAERQLIAAVESFRAAGVQELVLDIRYNGGGYLYIASQLAYMIAGPGVTSGKVFERLQYNDKRSADTTAAAAASGFFTTTCDPDGNFNCTTQDTLPSLGLSRVYVLASGSTCSASESVINGLRGVDIDVQIIGGTTCGKPYGFNAQDNCGISYFPIEFQGVNAKNFGDYADGFAPQCAAPDDLDHPLGNPAEGRLAAALQLIGGGGCPVSGSAKPAGRVTAQAAPSEATSERFLVRQPARENRINAPLRPRSAP